MKNFKRTIFLTFLVSFFAHVFIPSSQAQPDSTAVADSNKSSLGSGEQLNGDGIVTVTKVKRRNGVLTVKGFVSCGSNPCSNSTYLPNAYLLDEERGVKYHVIKTSDGGQLTSDSHVYFKGRNKTKFWAKFTAPPEEIKAIDFYFTDVEPIEGVSIADS